MSVFGKDIARRIKESDRVAFNELCLNLYPAMISYARVFIPNQEAEDVVQDVLLGLWMRRETIKEDYDLRAYVFKSIYNRSLNYIRRENLSANFRAYNERRILLYEHEALDPDKNPVVKKLFDGDLRLRLQKAIAALPPKQREVFRLHFIDEMPNKEISQSLSIALSTVENHINAALKKLKSILSDEELALLLVLIQIPKIFPN